MRPRSSRPTAPTRTRPARRPDRRPRLRARPRLRPARFGFQPVEAYDILVANLDPNLHREPPPETPAPLLDRFDDGLTTQEVAALMAGNNETPDRAAAEAALLELVGAGD